MHRPSAPAMFYAQNHSIDPLRNQADVGCPEEILNRPHAHYRPEKALRADGRFPHKPQGLQHCPDNQGLSDKEL